MEKKWILVLSLFVVLVIAGCGDTNPEEEIVCIEDERGFLPFDKIYQEYDAENYAGYVDQSTRELGFLPNQFEYGESSLFSDRELADLGININRYEDCPESEELEELVRQIRLPLMLQQKISIEKNSPTRAALDVTTVAGISEGSHIFIATTYFENEESAKNYFDRIEERVLEDEKNYPSELFDELVNVERLGANQKYRVKKANSEVFSLTGYENSKQYTFTLQKSNKLIAVDYHTPNDDPKTAINVAKALLAKIEASEAPDAIYLEPLKEPPALGYENSNVQDTEEPEEELSENSKYLAEGVNEDDYAICYQDDEGFYYRDRTVYLYGEQPNGKERRNWYLTEETEHLKERLLSFEEFSNLGLKPEPESSCMTYDEFLERSDITQGKTAPPHISEQIFLINGYYDDKTFSTWQYVLISPNSNWIGVIDEYSTVEAANKAFLERKAQILLPNKHYLEQIDQFIIESIHDTPDEVSEIASEAGIALSLKIRLGS